MSSKRNNLKIKTSHILFLPGVTKAVFRTLEERMKDKMFPGLENESYGVNPYYETIVKETDSSTYAIIDSNSSYKALPKIFTDMDSWPKTADLLCWECSLGHKNVPVFIPTQMTTTINNSGEETITMTTYGHFCSFPCACKYLNNKFSREVVWGDYYHLLRMLCSLFTGIPTNKIYLSPGPDKTERREYCGESGISVQEFSKKVQDINIVLEGNLIEDLSKNENPINR
jgi:hypothetical protein